MNREKEFENKMNLILNIKDKEELRSTLEMLDHNVVDELGQSVLHIACKEGNKDIVTTLIEIYELKNQKLHLISTEDKKGWTPIYYAIDTSESGFPDLVEILLKKGADPNKKDSKGITALHLASYKGQDDNVEILLKYKTDLNIKDVSGRIALNYAIMEGQTNSVQALLEGNSNLENVDINGDSLIHYAILCKGNALLYVIMLAEKGVDLNKQNKEGDTPLNLCAITGAKENIRIIQKLLTLNADPNIKNKKGENFYSLLGTEAEKGNSNLKNQIKKASNFNFVMFYIILPVCVLLLSRYKA